MSRLLLFLAVFLCIYGSLHLYVLMKVRRAFYYQGWSYILLFVVLAYLTLAPIQARVLESQGYPILSMMTSWIAFIWMGYLFVFVCVALPLDGYHIVLTSLQRVFRGDFTWAMLSRRQSLALAAIVAGGIMIYGLIEAQRIQVESITLHSAKIPPAAQKVRIVQISDLHLGVLRYPGRLSAMVEAIEAAQPDILVSTGDLVDGAMRNPAGLTQALAALTAPLGKFAVTGNHEMYVGLKLALEFTQASGFKVLQGRSVVLTDAIAIAGVDDPAGGPSNGPLEKELLANLSGNRFNILLKHRPVIDPNASKHFDLQLSGHTHKGQIFPFGALVKLRYPLYHGLYRIGPDKALYVNRGTGTWGPPIRVLAPPEITVIDIVPARRTNKNTPTPQPIRPEKG